ncbi:MAG: pyridoxal phosphate-dependent aminotransferase [Firmicutes bacterium]|nr:pyridoxal phosphate-dependent aminotransferase [Bacillota bacterium]
MFDFDHLPDRRNTASYKWDVPEGELPLWVADMDFPAAPCIREAFAKRIEHGVFGYNIIPDSWYEAYQSWWQRRHGFFMEREWLLFVTGVVPGMSSIIRKLTTPNENILIQSPVYNIFFSTIRNNGGRILENQLVYEEASHSYQIDFEDMEKKLADPQTSLMILCNPHNPVGKIWDKETLQKIAELCEKYHVICISDEIHCDITAPGKQYVPFLSVSETARKVGISLIAPTKCFNLAGLQTAAICVPDPFLRHKVWRGINTDDIAEAGSFALTAVEAAFGEGEPWLEALRVYLEANKTFVRNFLQENLPEISLVPSEATYLLWLDCRKLGHPSEGTLADCLESFLRKEAKVYLTSGSEYGQSGDEFLRLNIATSRERLEEGMNRLKAGIDLYRASRA